MHDSDSRREWSKESLMMNWWWINLMVLACENMKMELHFLPVILQYYLSSLLNKNLWLHGKTAVITSRSARRNSKDTFNREKICNNRYTDVTRSQNSGSHTKKEQFQSTKEPKLRTGLKTGEWSVLLSNPGGQPDGFRGSNSRPSCPFYNVTASTHCTCPIFWAHMDKERSHGSLLLIDSFLVLSWWFFWVDAFRSADIFDSHRIDMMKPLDGTIAGRKEKASHSSCFPITRARWKHSCMAVLVSCANQPQTIATYYNTGSTSGYTATWSRSTFATEANWKLSDPKK